MEKITETTTAIERLAKLNGRTVAAFFLLGFIAAVLMGWVDTSLLDGHVGIVLAACTATATYLLLGVNVDRAANAASRINGDVAHLSQRIGEMSVKLEACETGRALLMEQNRLLTEEVALLKKLLEYGKNE